jgi:localization factor PodJL
MKSGGPWNLRGLRPEAREAARAAARRSGMSVGEWLNSVIEPADDDDIGGALRSPPLAHERAARWPQDLRPHVREEFHPNFDRDLHEDERDYAPRARHAGHAGAPYREAPRHDRVDHVRRERERERDHEREEVSARLDDLSRQVERLARASMASPRPAPAQRPWSQAPRDPGDEPLSRLTGAPPRRAGDAMPERMAPAGTPSASTAAPNAAPMGNQDISIEQAVAEITARQRALDGEEQAPVAPPLSPLSAEDAFAARPEGRRFERMSEPAVDLTGLERQLRQLTAQIETLRPGNNLDKAMDGLRDDLAEIGKLITEALPRRAVESLEIEVKALAQRIDHSRQSGVDTHMLAGLERGLADVRESLRGLTTAESLVGVDEAVKALAHKVDLIAAKDDPAALQQLETAIGALRGIVAHVASNDALAKVAEDVRALAAKVDSLANTAASGRAISALETRLDTLANALNASTEAGQAVPRELEKLLAGLIEKLEWVQLTHTDHAALAHLEDRIAMLVKRLDASDARLGQLAGVERGLADLLVLLDQMRGKGGDGKIVLGGDVQRDVAEIKQSERRTQDSLEAVQGTVEHVVDRLATIESGLRTGDKLPASPAALVSAQSSQAAATPQPSLPPAPPAAKAAAAAPAMPAAMPKSTQVEPASRAAAPRPPIDPNLPPDHPLEPGSASGRSRQPASAADRIAASEAATGAKPPVIADPGSKSDFIAAARRAARTAALDTSEQAPRAEAASSAAAAVTKNLPQRLRPLLVAAAVVVLIVGVVHIASRWFEDGAGAPSDAQIERGAPNASGSPGSSPARPSSPAPTASPLTVAPAQAPANAAAPPSAAPEPPASGGTTGPKPRRQSLNEGPVPLPTAQETAAAAAAPTGAAIDAGMNTAATQWPAPDVTGSLPPPASPSAPAVPAPTPLPSPVAGSLDDKLPAAIGGPALRAAALAGDPAAAYEVATHFAEGRGVAQNNEEAAHWLDRAAKMGLAPAQFRLGSLYEKGLGVKKDLAAARDLYRAAADQGHGKAMHNLAVLYAEGIDGASDYHAAAHWFRAAADRGLTDSQYNLGILYARGIGVDQSFAESYKWFSLAAKQGDNDAAKKRDEVASHLDREALAAARLAAQAWRAEPQPAEAITVKVPPAWNAPANATPAARSRPRVSGAKTPPTDATKVD